MFAYLVPWLLGAYLLGAIPTSYLVARVFAGTDLRTFGSRNLGATNLYRLLGLKAAVPTALFDIAKGTVPVMLQAARVPDGSIWPIVVGLAAVAGHVFSPFVGFKGGKGVATAAGAFLGLMPLSILIALVVWLTVLFAFRFMSLASMLGAAAFAGSVPFLYPGRPAWHVAAALVFVFIVFTHRANVRRLLSGTENKLGRRQGEARA